MSGSAPGTSFPNIVPVFSDVLPPEGSKMCSINLLWANTFASPPLGQAQINLLSAFNSGQFTTIQAVYVDNSTVPYQVTLTSLDTGFSLKIPPFSQGVFPFLSSTAPQIVAQLNYVVDRNSGLIAYQNCTTKLYFLNTPRTPFLEVLPNFGNNFAQLTAFNLTGSATAGNLVQFIAPGGANTFYRITSLNAGAILVVANGTYFGAELIIAEMGTTVSGNAPSATSWYKVRLFVSSGAGGAVGDLLAYTANFDPPIMTINPNNGIGIFLSNAPANLNSVEYNLTMTYGTVLIQ